MTDLLRGSFYRLRKDWAIRIGLIIAVAFAVIMNLIYFGLSNALAGQEFDLFAYNVQTMFMGSLSPSDNVGIAIPIIVAIFIVSEFNAGTIRSKITVGHSRISIYCSLLIVGFAMTCIMLVTYVGLSSLLAFAMGGSLDGISGLGLFQYAMMALCVYIFVTSFSVFFATLFRNLGPTITVIILFLVILSIIGTIVSGVAIFLEEGEQIDPYAYHWSVWINPFYTFSSGMLTAKGLADWPSTWFAASIVTPLYWSAILICGGAFLFIKRDVK